jgi:hypothetical protein
MRQNPLKPVRLTQRKVLEDLAAETSRSDDQDLGLSS